MIIIIFFLGKPESVRIWLIQCGLYMSLLCCVKIVITLLITLDFWQIITKFIMSPFTDPRTELTIVMLIIPLFINVSKIISVYNGV